MRVGGEGEGQPRRRRPHTGEAEPREGGVEEVRGEAGDRSKNPLNWFGVLIPQALKQSQEHFVRGQ